MLRRPDRAALLGLTSAAVATDLANTLYSEWDWVFQLAGIWACSRRGLARASQGARLSCRPATEAQAFRPGLVVTELASYGTLYATWLGGFGETEPLSSERNHT